MFTFDKSLSLAKLLEQLSGSSLTRYTSDEIAIEDVYIKRIASLTDLLESEFCITNEKQQYSLCFATSIEQRLTKLQSSVLLAPKDILAYSNGSLYETLSQGNVVITVNNPRLEFIKLASIVEVHINNQNSTETKNETVVFGKHCEIKEGASLGLPGFGFERDVDGTPIRFPHFGRVVLGDDVTVGTNTVISKGTLDDTVIGESTKIDDLVYIAHNCIIGKRVMIAGNATLCGGVQVGDDAWIGAGASVKQNIKIGEGAVVGLGAVVTKNVSPHTTVVGNPARIVDSKAQQKQQTQGAA